MRELYSDIFNLRDVRMRNAFEINALVLVLVPVCRLSGMRWSWNAPCCAAQAQGFTPLLHDIEHTSGGR